MTVPPMWPPYNPTPPLPDDLVAILPIVTVTKSQTGSVGTVTVNITDLQGRVDSVEFQTQVGVAAPSAWIPDTLIPYSTTVPFTAGDVSVIRWQVIGFDANDAPGQILAAGEEYFPLGGGTSSPYYTIPYMIDGGGLPIVAGFKGGVEIDIPGDIAQVTLLSMDTSGGNIISGDIKVDIQKRTYATHASPSVADSICAGAEPEIVAGVKARDATLPGWDVGLLADDHLFFEVLTAATLTRVLLSIKILKA